jgi:hypothetical protein
LAYRYFHPDGSGGYSLIGDINFISIVSILALYASLAIVMFVHRQLNILQISGFLILSATLILLTYFISWPVIRFLLRILLKEKISNYRIIKQELNEVAILKLLWIESGPSFSPYSRYQTVVINATRLIPFLLTGIRLLGTP